MSNFSRLHTSMYAGGLIGKIDRNAKFCLLVYVIYVLFSCGNIMNFAKCNDVIMISEGL